MMKQDSTTYLRSESESVEPSTADAPKLRSVHSSSSISLGASSTSEAAAVRFSNSIRSGVAFESTASSDTLPIVSDKDFAYRSKSKHSITILYLFVFFYGVKSSLCRDINSYILHGMRW